MKNISLTATLCILAFFAAGWNKTTNDFQLTANVKAPATCKADSDTEFDKGSAIAFIPPGARTLNDLFIVGKVWGFVKYYHPALSAGDHNWDYELFRVLPKIIRCKNDKERNDSLYTWIGQLGACNTGNLKLPDSAVVKVYPDIQWIEDVSILGPQLSAQLNDIKNAPRNKTGYYTDLDKTGTPSLKNEKAYADMHFPDAGFRLLALYRYWNIIQYLYPYKYLIKENWNDVLREFIPKFLNAGNELDYKLAVLALIARIHDTHAHISDIDPILGKYWGNYYAPLELTFVENKAVVTYAPLDDQGTGTVLKKGDIIISIDGKNTDSLVKEKLPFTPASNYPTQLRELAINLLRTNDTVLNISYQRENAIYTTRVSCYLHDRVSLLKKYQHYDTCFRYVTPGIAYIYPGTIRNDWLAKKMPDFLKTKGMIIDLRCYPSDMIHYVLGSYLLPEQTNFARITNVDTEIPGLFVFDRYSKVGKSNPDYYKGRLVILVNERTQSAAEFTAMALRVTPGATVVGSTTAGADGNISRFFLPGGIGTAISGIGIYYPDGRETQRVGIVPDYTVQPTVQGIIQNRDEVLEKAIALIDEK